MSRRSYKKHERLPYLSEHKVWAEIDTEKLKNNYKKLDALVKSGNHDAKMIAVVKADAYGHGIEPCAVALWQEGCRHFAVSCVDEAIALRGVLDELEGSKWKAYERSMILVLGYTLPTQAELLYKYQITTALLDRANAEALAREAKAKKVQVDVHISLDTGMNRVGFCACGPSCDDENIDELLEDIASVFSMDGIRVTGMFTHFARADEEYAQVMSPDSHTAMQYKRYVKILKGLEARGLDVGMCHVCNSAAALRFSAAAAEGKLLEMLEISGGEQPRGMDAVRMGILLYGVRPSEYVETDLCLEPVMRLCTIVTHIHTLHQGESVSYGGTFMSDTPRKIATLPIGYADGFVRAFGGANVTLHTSKGHFSCPIVGRICMDQCMIDITDADGVAIGDKVTLFGREPSELERLAQLAGTIEYECICIVSARVARIASVEAPTDDGEKSIKNENI